MRPGFLLVVGDQLWAVDEFQPVAAVLDSDSGAVRWLVSGVELPDQPATGPDELGRHTPPEYAGVHLMEVFDSNQLPPASEAVDGKLSI